MRQIRRSFRNLRRTLPDVVNVLFLFFFSLAIFALMAYKLFGERSESTLRFSYVLHILCSSVDQLMEKTYEKTIGSCLCLHRIKRMTCVGIMESAVNVKAVFYKLRFEVCCHTFLLL